MKILYILQNDSFLNQEGPHDSVLKVVSQFYFTELFSIDETYLLQHDIIIISESINSSNVSNSIVNSYASLFWDIYIEDTNTTTFSQMVKSYDIPTKEFLCRRRHRPIPSTSFIPIYSKTIAISTRSPRFLSSVRPFLAEISQWKKQYETVDINLLAHVASFSHTAAYMKIHIGSSLNITDAPQKLPTLKIFVLSYNQESYLKAQSIASRYKDWAEAYLIPDADVNNNWQENKFFLNLPSLPEVDYLGFLSYSCEKKINLESLNRAINTKTYLKYDFIGLAPNTSTTKFYDTHPFFRAIWNDILANKFGFCNAVDIEENFFNYWIARSDLVKQYCDFLKERLCPELKKHPLIMKNANYHAGKFSKQHLKKLHNVEYFPHHPFILERVPRMYFKKENKKLAKLISSGRFIDG